MAKAKQKTRIVSDGVVLELTQEEANLLRDVIGNIGFEAKGDYSVKKISTDIFTALHPITKSSMFPFKKVRKLNGPGFDYPYPTFSEKYKPKK